MRTSFFSVLVILAAVASACGQPASLENIAVSGENRQSAQRLQAADRLLQMEWTPAHIAAIAGQLGSGMQTAMMLAADGSTLERWLEALDVYQRLLDTAGDDLVPLAAEGGGAWVRSATVRRLCQQRLATAPPSVLQIHRQRVDADAMKLLRQGQDSRDVKAVRRLLDSYSCSRFTDQALDLLGDLAFEKGHFDEAIFWWRSLALESRRQPAEVDLARVSAKQMIAQLFQGDRAGFLAQLPAFEKQHGTAQGFLAGRTGNYAAILRSVWQQLPRDANDDGWTTFGGQASRNHVARDAPSPHLWAGGPTWRVRLGPEARPGEPDPILPTPQGARRLAFHPVIVDDKILLADARSVSAYALRTGQLLFRYDLKTAGHDDGVDPAAKRWPPPVDARFTLSVDGARAFVRLGRIAFAPRREGVRAEEISSYLVCLDLSDGAREREVWSVVAKGPIGASVMFEGAPLVHDGNVFIAISHVLGRRTHTAIACHGAATGELLWSRPVCEAPEFDDPSEARTQHHLLTLAGPNLVYGSHSGAIVAVDAASGKRSWALRYAPDDRPSPRDLCPCVFAGQRVYAAPRDTHRLFCLDPASGTVLWERDGLEIVQLLGVSAGRLFFTTTHGLRAVDAARGLDQGGWAQPDEGRLATFGRGLLAGGWIFWPTQDALLPVRALTQEEGHQAHGQRSVGSDPTLFRRLPPGNMAWAHGCLVVADGEHLSTYLSPSKATR